MVGQPTFFRLSIRHKPARYVMGKTGQVDLANRRISSEPLSLSATRILLYQNCAKIQRFHSIRVTLERKADSPICWER